MSFSRHKEIYRSDVVALAKGRTSLAAASSSAHACRQVERGSSMSFLRHTEIYRSDVVGLGKRRTSLPASSSSSAPGCGQVEPSSSMSFRRHKEIYRSDIAGRSKGRQLPLSPLPHRLDEFPVGYSWRVALQQSPLPLYQPRLIVRLRSVEAKNFFRPGAGVS